LFKNKLFNMALIIIIAITLLGIVFFVLYRTNFLLPNNNTANVEKVKEPSIDEILKSKLDIPEITTNLSDGRYIVIALSIQLDNEKAKVEAEKRIFQIKDKINLLLKSVSSQDLSTEDGIIKLKLEIMNRVNQIMQDGKINNIDITKILIN